MDGSKHNPAHQPPNQNLFPVVGIGASAGGLRVLQRFLLHTPVDSGMAFVIVTHLSPEHESHLPALLQPNTAMPVIQIAEETDLSPNHVYIIPPGRNLQSIDSQLRLAPLEPDRRQRAPIDHFLRTLADSHDSLAIAVILTGTGSDGALGLRRIKEVGGLTVAQDPAEAEYDSMPQSAIATGDVEVVLPVAEIPRRLAQYVQSKPQLPVPPEGQPLPEEVGEEVQKILTQVRLYTGQDFLLYKQATILRRIRRRMQIHDFTTLGDYLAYLRGHASEVQALYKDFLITVTNFFRDPEAFAYLESAVIPQLFQGKSAGDQVRVWTAGCATGEEAYSLAILLLEYANKLTLQPDIQIFASDLSEEGLQQARAGFYPETIAADLSSERLERFFTKEQGGYRVRQAVRERVLFTLHSLLKDPPFSRLDLICCRNLLIYLNREAQQQVLQIFHYALRPDGYLLLGSAETVESSELFRAQNRKQSLYRRQPAPAVLPPPLLLPVRRRSSIGLMPSTSGMRESGYRSLHIRALERYAPPSILVNADRDIVYFADGSDRYLQQPPGEPTNNALLRIRDELRIELTTALYRASEQGIATQSAPIPIGHGDQMRQVSLLVQPIADHDLPGFVLVIFLESDLHEGVTPTTLIRDQTIVVQGLESELATTKNWLQINIEEYEISQEELRASNEELQSMNEELRSAAEELETSKEELQSINEELLTVNQENKNKIEELGQLTGDLQNLLSSTEIATLFLDRELHIKRFTPRISDLFNVLSTDRGRPLAHITHKLGAADLILDAQQVLRTLTPLERELSSNDGRWYIMRLLPYRTPDDRIDGVVITFVDINEIKRAEARVRESEERLRALINQTTAGICRTDANGRLTFASQKFCEMLGYADESEVVGQTLWDFTQGDLLAENQQSFSQLFATGKAFEIEMLLLRKDGTSLWANVGVSAIRDNTGKLQSAVAVILDISERKRAEDALRASEEKYRTLFESIDQGYCLIEMIYDQSGKPVDWLYLEANATFEKQSGVFAPGKKVSELVGEVEAFWIESYARVLETGEPARLENRVAHLDRWYRIFAARVGGPGSHLLAVVFDDITERKRREVNLAFLAEVMVDFASFARPEELMQGIGEKLAQHLALARCDFSVVEVEADRITTIYDWRRDADAPSLLGEHAISTFLTPAAQQQYIAGHLAVINDVRNHPLSNAPAEMMDALGIGAVIDAPYLENGHWKFLLSVIHSEAHVWRTDEIELIGEMAARIYIRLERARAEEAVHQSEAKLAVELAGAQQLQQVSSQLIQEDDIAALHQHLIAAAVAIMQADMISLQMLDPISNKLRLLAWTGFAPDATAFWDQVGPDSSSSCGVALATGRRVIIPDVESADSLAGTEDLAAYQRSGIKAVQSTPLVARSGQIVGMISTHWRTTHEPGERELRLLDVLAREAADLIEQRNAIRALHQSEEHLRLLIESATDYAIFTTDLERCVVSWNSGAEAIFGYSANEVIGQLADIIFTPEDRAAGAPIDEATTALATGRAADERWHMRKDGSRFYASGVLTPLRDSEVRGFVKIARDLTATQQAAAERERLLAALAQEQAGLQKLNATLERRVEERTQELAEKNQELDRFAYLAAHDLKEPLRGIERLTEWIVEAMADQLPPATQAHLDRLQQRVRRVTQLVDDLLVYARIGRTTYNVEIVEPATLIHNIVELLEPPPGCRVTINEPMPRLVTVRIPLETIFLNLLQNAIKHHHQPETCQLVISAEEQDAWIEFAVRDNGPGIDPTQQARIFELFQALRPRDEVEGSGMGLPIVQRILERYGGAIRVESNPTSGVTFRFTWPREM